MTSCDQFFQPFPKSLKKKTFKLSDHFRFMITRNQGKHMDALFLLKKGSMESNWFRWTRDLVPVVVHDPDLERVFGMDYKSRNV